MTFRRERVGLRIVDLLELVLHVAQEDISLRERVAFLRRDERLIAKRAERLQGVALAYLRELGAAADLQRLDDQLDFANAAGAEFDVAAALLADGHLLIDLALDASHFFQRFEVKGPVVNEGISHF